MEQNPQAEGHVRCITNPWWCHCPFAVALDCIKPLAIGAAFQAFGASNIVRGALLSLLGLVAVLYSLSAEISLIATNRTDIVAERTNSTYFASQSMRKYEAARDELKALPPSRLVEEIEAERVKTSNEAKLAKLAAESARAKRRIELQSVINSYLELLPVPRTPGLGVMMGLEVAYGTTEFQPRVQARGGAVGARAWGVGCAGGA